MSDFIGRDVNFEWSSSIFVEMFPYRAASLRPITVFAVRSGDKASEKKRGESRTGQTTRTKLLGASPSSALSSHLSTSSATFHHRTRERNQYSNVLLSSESIPMPFECVYDRALCQIERPLIASRSDAAVSFSSLAAVLVSRLEF